MYEKCGCESEGCSYTPGQYTEPVGVFDVTQLFRTLYDSVHSLHSIFCSISKVAPLQDGSSTQTCSNSVSPTEEDEDTFTPPPL